ncbi:MAG: hypothetical protein ACO2PN_13355 [Pyrobaculum sp.]|jgi:hypothetical protein
MKCKNPLDIIKVVSVAVVPTLIIVVGATAGMHTVNELLSATTRKELIERLIWAIIVWLLTPAVKIGFAVSVMKMELCDEKAIRIAPWLYAAGFAASLTAFFMLYPPYFATFKEGWREFTEFVYFMPVVSTYTLAFSRLIHEL